MGLSVSFELDDGDLTHFRLIMREARKAAARLTPEDIVAAAETQLTEFDGSSTPGFIRDRIDRLQMLIRMVSDIDWRLPHPEVKRVLNALAYFAEPDDLIPDHIPGLGFLDDAIMVELVMRELEHEIEAYRDFCAFRGDDRQARRQSALSRRRDELQARMRERREARRSDSDLDPRLFDKP